jgi:hypothetical protein
VAERVPTKNHSPSPWPGPCGRLEEPRRAKWPHGRGQSHGDDHHRMADNTSVGVDDYSFGSIASRCMAAVSSAARLGRRSRARPARAEEQASGRRGASVWILSPASELDDAQASRRGEVVLPLRPAQASVSVQRCDALSRRPQQLERAGSVTYLRDTEGPITTGLRSTRSSPSALARTPLGADATFSFPPAFPRLRRPARQAGLRHTSAGLQTGKGAAAPRLEGSIPSPLRSRDPARAVGSGLCAALRGRAGRCRPGPHELRPQDSFPPRPPEAYS